MLSFKTLSLLATVAFAAFTSASPMPAPVAELSARGGDYVPLPEILNTCHQSLIPLALNLKASVDLKSKVALAVQLEASVLEIKAVINVAIDAVNTCKAKSGDKCKSNNGTPYVVKDIAKLLHLILIVVFTAIWDVLCLVGTLKAHLIRPLLCTIADLVADLLVLVFGLVDGLLFALLAIIGKVAGIILCLGATKLIACLGGLLGFIALPLPLLPKLL
ncbi:hypothetical protein HGRIS_014221 [Hohenbuehelia grisea]|uniref:Uncharacterized protein n=1 Tax=Hohenbuehelia grisea TaxID=104357 RepID=A0ABR3JUT3_9AGAR